MPNYDVLDKIADSYNPVLLIAFIVFSIIYYKRGDQLAGLKGLLGVLVCYLVMRLDNQLKLWESISLDYSTHSSVAFSLTYFLIHKRDVKSAASIGIITSLIFYYLLELYQKYHTILDIVSTLIVVMPLVFCVYKGVDRLKR